MVTIGIAGRAAAICRTSAIEASSVEPARRATWLARWSVVPSASGSE